MGVEWDVHRHEEGQRREPAAGGVQLGTLRADRLRECRRQEAARDPDQAGRLRSVEEGASVVNVTGACGGIGWGSGMPRAFQYEKTQSRIGPPLWENPMLYVENSPLFWVQKIQTPYLTMANDEDDAVPWYQGIEFFSAMRHLGKEAYMFVYNGEKHGLRQRDNQKHWTVHMAEYFDYFLKYAPKPEWM